MIILLAVFVISLFGVRWSNLEVQQSKKRLTALALARMNGARQKVAKTLLHETLLRRRIQVLIVFFSGASICFLWFDLEWMRHLARLTVLAIVCLSTYKSYISRHERMELIEEWEHEQERETNGTFGTSHVG